MMDNNQRPTDSQTTHMISGVFTQLDGESFYKITNVDQMPPFFISVVSDQDHWLFSGSQGGLTMGRVSPETAVFPYVTVDKLYESTLHTGPRTLLKVISQDGANVRWEPFNREHDDRFSLTRNLYKSVLGNVLCFEEINHDLQLSFRYMWRFSDEFGIVRECRLSNLSNTDKHVSLLDGLQNVLPAGTPRFTQTASSNLVDAYKWTELDDSTGLALYTLYSAITDRAEPVEALRANTVFSYGLDHQALLLNADCVAAFKADKPLQTQYSSRGVRGAYFIASDFTLAPGADKDWNIVVDIEQDQAQVVELKQALEDKASVAEQIKQSCAEGSDKLARIMAASDGFQTTGEPIVGLHHYANTLFNVMRGGIFADQYRISRADLLGTIKIFNSKVFAAHRDAISALPETLNFNEVRRFAESTGDVQLQRIVYEYLPITFGRRHGDPSRPWNQFAIELKDELGNPLLSYQGNWRDIFQNWEALLLSYPDFIESVIAKFVNASTVDGYNPYRITKQGIDWEVEEPDDPWSYIGYWGDHQIIYLLKLLEESADFHPGLLSSLLTHPLFSYANVPYRIKDFDGLVANPKDTVMFDNELAELIDHRVETIGADGKMLLTAEQQVYQVNLMEKLLVPLLSKLSNLVIDGGIWLNTQRPEWNDANNALVGQGLSMVTLYYMNRYVSFMQNLLSSAKSGSFQLTEEVATWLHDTASILTDAASQLDDGPASAQLQYDTLARLGRVASDYRAAMYNHSGDFKQVEVSSDAIANMLAPAQQLIAHSIDHNLDSTGLYHAYNTLAIDESSLSVGHLYDMLEGQVAALSSRALSPEHAAQVIDTLFDSAIYREDQHTFMLYPDREQQRFLDKNQVSNDDVERIALLKAMLANHDTRLVKLDEHGKYRFNSDLTNAAALRQKWAQVKEDYLDLATDEALKDLLDMYEGVFNHRAFTGRSGGMFGFEGLGCIYWHMVSKLLLAVQEIAVDSVNDAGMTATSQKLIDQYYKVRHGIGFNKTPDEYGAFPADPYSHTPKHAGAQQPGMTGQVKEELIARMRELGCFVEQGKITLNPFMLREQEFTSEPTPFRYLDVDNIWQQIDMPVGSLGFSWCQVPVIYTVDNDADELAITLFTADGENRSIDGNQLDEADSRHVFERDGAICQINVVVPAGMLFKGSK
ncbi:hypothetical protein [Aestuariibacter salexigens]|uniref:hypothetical protein n=1 Tax=Aestuariibacter salexigens TaxID=226010 RepID=UPI001F0A73D3|nr:hypothetical protein [Aestuariibacter salexigens]